MRYMKAQASLEFLIILAVFFSMLVVSFSILMNIKHTGDESVRTSRLMMVANDLEDTVNEICVLGEGSRKTVRFPLEKVTIDVVGSGKNQHLKIVYMNETAYTDKLICEVDADNVEGSAVEVHKESGVVYIDAV